MNSERTSVLVAYYLPEPLSERVERVVPGGGTPSISPLAELEFVSVLARKHSRHRCDEALKRIVDRNSPVAGAAHCRCARRNPPPCVVAGGLIASKIIGQERD